MATPDAQTRAMIAKLEETTGKKLDAWVKIVRASGVEKHGEIVKLLKSKHGVTHGYANLIAQAARPGGAAEGDELVDTQYRGKEALRPWYDQLIAAVKRFGADVEVSPKKGYVSLRRTKQFALIQPSTNTRLDVGINLKGVSVAPAPRLEVSGSFNAMVSHRVRVSSAGEIDKQLLDWLRKAYEAA